MSAQEPATGCAIHPVTANPFCDTCREHGNPHPFEVAEDAWLVDRVRKDGSVRVGSTEKAVRLVEAAAAAGYTFGRRQTVMGVVVLDLDD